MAPLAGREASAGTGTGRSAGGADDMQSCIQICNECHRVCLETAQHCLQTGGAHARPDHIRTLLDCADICRTSADFMVRGSQHHAVTCRACAEICGVCADSCEQLGGADMERCAEVCRRCAESCARMAAAGSAH
jgi:hypothetical protein